MPYKREQLSDIDNMKVFFAIVATVFVASCGNETMANVTISGQEKQLLMVFNKEAAKPQAEAKQICECNFNGTLAAVNISNIEQMAQLFNEPAWIGSWNGDNYNGSCLVLQNTTITVGNCSEMRAFGCMVDLKLNATECLAGNGTVMPAPPAEPAPSPFAPPVGKVIC